ncbi:pectate lyase [Venturia nashicola]|nr:pectate lyase [Venturia nashicola]
MLFSKICLLAFTIAAGVEASKVKSKGHKSTKGAKVSKVPKTTMKTKGHGAKATDAPTTANATAPEAAATGGTKTSGGGNTGLQTVLPAAAGTSMLAAAQTIAAGESFDGKMFLFDRSDNTCAGQKEGGAKDGVFVVMAGGHLSNVIIGPNNGEGVHCMGPCFLENVWWKDVCEDALTLKQTSGTTYITGGGAFGAEDKVIQHNGGGAVIVKNFYAENIGKLYRSCGNCKTQYARKSTFENCKVSGGKIIAGINGNLGDVSTISNSCILGGAIVCDLFEGTDNNSVEPHQTAAVPDGKTCATAAVTLEGC